MNRDRDYIREKYKKNVEKKMYLEKPIVSGFDGCFSISEIPSGLFDNKLKNLGYVYGRNIEYEIRDLKFAIRNKYKIDLGLFYCKQLREDFGSITKVLNRLDDIPEERFRSIVEYTETIKFGFIENFINYIIDIELEIPKYQENDCSQKISFSEYIAENSKNTIICEEVKEYLSTKTKIKNFFNQLFS